jgi:hypothetical protein
MDESRKYVRAFRVAAVLTLVVLVVYTALFVAFPDSLVNGNAWEWAMQRPVIVAHMLVGTLLVVSALVALGFGIAMKSKAAVGAAVVGLLSMVIAYMYGAMFLTNVQANGYSFNMSLAFIATLLAYGYAVYAIRQLPQKIA